MTYNLKLERVKDYIKSKVNNKFKCSAISQVIRTKLYNNCLIFVFKIFSLLLYGTISHILFSFPPHVDTCYMGFYT